MLTRMSIRSLALCLSIIVLLAQPGCKKERNDQELYAQVAASAGFGIAFGSSPDQVHLKLGKPTATVERGKIIEDFYVTVPPGYQTPEMPDNDQTQLRLTYYDKKLVKVYNRYRPEQPGALNPPVVVQPLPGVKLGLKRSQIEALLGKPNYGELRDGWQFVGEDGSSVVILPHYTEVESLGESLASSISIEHVDPGAADLGKGEFFKKKKAQQEAVHSL
jgi:hypothetical protein